MGIELPNISQNKVTYCFMSDSQEIAFQQALASVSLETNTLTEDVVALLKQAMIDQKTPSELLDMIENAH